MKHLRPRASQDPQRFGWNWFFTYLGRRSSFDRVAFGTLLILALVSGGFWLWQSSYQSHVTVLSDGGVMHEGIVGAPRFINPVLATTRADQDMVALMYRGLYTFQADGALVPDLASSITVSDDGRTYNVELKSGQQWHDGVEITAEDVAYTIGLVQNPELRSPIRGNWNDVTVEQIDTYELNIVLEEPYAPFIENLTLGILPRHLWQGFTPDEFPFSEYNTEPVGSGPFSLQEIVRNQAGIATQYRLIRFEQYEPAPAMAGVVVHFFTDEAAAADALDAGTITHTAALSQDRIAALDESSYQVYEAPLPRVFGLYPNQNRNAVLRDQAAREALSVAIDRAALVEQVLAGYGEVTTSPLPTGFVATGSSTVATSSDSAVTRLLAGGWEQTEAGGWEKDIDDVPVPLAVTITTANSPLFEATAAALTDAWEALGVEVSVALYEQGDLVQAVIRPRDYELLLFGTDVGRALDYYPFWHSSQRDDPGLNVAQYTSIATDEYLEAYRTTSDPVAQADLLQSFATAITEETPAIFLFNPTFTYVTTSDTPLTLPDRLGRPSDRFALIHDWHIESESLWPIFISN